MAIRSPGIDPVDTEQAPGGGPNRAPERDHAPAPAHARARDEGGQVLALPVVHTGEVAPAEAAAPARTGGLARARTGGARLAGDAYRAGRAAVDGSLWRWRPASLRDIHARTQRADWAGESRGLLAAGTVYGYVALVLVAVLYTAAEVITWTAVAVRNALIASAEVVKRPLRLAVATVIVLVPVLVAVLL